MKLGNHPDDKPATARMRYVFLLVAVVCAFVLLAAGHLPTSRGATVQQRILPPKVWGVEVFFCDGGVSTDWWRYRSAQIKDYSEAITANYSRSTRVLHFKDGKTHLTYEWDSPKHCDGKS